MTGPVAVPCACGGSFVVYGDPQPAILAHNRTPIHQDWRERADIGGKPDMRIFAPLLGPAPCKDCRRFLWWTGTIWREEDGTRHYCATRAVA